MKELLVTFDNQDKLSNFIEEIDKKGDYFYTFDFNQPKEVKFYQLTDEDVTFIKGVSAKHKGARESSNKRSLRRRRL